MGTERLKLITFSSLYPSDTRPTFALFVEARLKHLLQTAKTVESVVVAPVAWFPFRQKIFGRYASFADTPRESRRSGIRVLYPRFFPMPGLWGALKVIGMFTAALPVLRGLRKSGYDFDLIDAHYFYPDGVAAALAACYFKVPLIITGRGSDLNLHGRRAVPRKLMLWACRRASAVVTVSGALREVATSLGMSPDKLHVLRNGVDARFFRPLDRNSLRKSLGVDACVLLSVGNLVPEKGHDLAIEVLSLLPGSTQLFIVGAGPELARLRRRASELGLAARVTFVGAVPQAKLVEYYNIADVLVLASSREGWPNVLLEAMACGTPAVATDVGGCREVISAPEAGLLVRARTAESIARCVLRVQEIANRAATRRHAERFSWDETAAGQLALMEAALTDARSTTCMARTLPTEASAIQDPKRRSGVL